MRVLHRADVLEAGFAVVRMQGLVGTPGVEPEPMLSTLKGQCQGELQHLLANPRPGMGTSHYHAMHVEGVFGFVVGRPELGVGERIDGD